MLFENVGLVPLHDGIPPSPPLALIIMKIVVTKRELQSILSSHFRVNVTEVEMTESTPELLDLLKTKISPLISPTTKIQAIKDLRVLSSQNPLLGMPAVMGLFEAKYAVENWGPFLKFVEDNGRIPNIDSSGRMS